MNNLAESIFAEEKQVAEFDINVAPEITTNDGADILDRIKVELKNCIELYGL